MTSGTAPRDSARALEPGKLTGTGSRHSKNPRAFAHPLGTWGLGTEPSVPGILKHMISSILVTALRGLEWLLSIFQTRKQAWRGKAICQSHVSGR